MIRQAYGARFIAVQIVSGQIHMFVLNFSEKYDSNASL